MTYEFKCPKCGQEYEEQKKMDDFDSNCPVCDTKAEKLVSSPNVIKSGNKKPLDSVVGAAAEQRWQQIEEGKKKRDKVNYGDAKDAKAKDGQRIGKLLNRQNKAYDKIDKAKKAAGVTRQEELHHAIRSGGDNA